MRWKERWEETFCGQEHGDMEMVKTGTGQVRGCAIGREATTQAWKLVSVQKEVK